MTGSIRRSAVALLLAFFAVSAGLVYWQVFRSPELDSAPTNPRVAEASQMQQRGTILAANGEVLARSIQSSDGQFQREYTDPTLAQTIGYVSTRYGLDGLEATYNAYLSGQQGDDPFSAVWSDVARTPARGNDLVLTVDPALQKIAAQALGDRPGAVIALDPGTGAVRAIVSAPNYDPNKLDQIGASLLKDSEQPLLNRATQGLYPPGSTYKTVTAAAALDSGIVKPNDIYQCSGDGVLVSGFRVACTNAPPGQTQWTFENAYAYSINATFAQVALQIGPSRFTQYSQAFGVGESIPFDIDLATSHVLQKGSSFDDVLLASSGFGQGQLSVTPLQMALIAATVANGGVEPSPYLVGQIRDPDGGVIEDHHPAPRGRVMRPETAATMRQFMQASVRLGWGQEAGLQGLDVAGKSGTAETGIDGHSHAWVIGYAPASAPKLAVAVIVENGGAGGIAAGQVAAQLFKAVLGK
jgi:peptidoglycan glycosyltransferase